VELDKIEEREKNRSSFRFQLTLFFIFFFVSIFAVFIITSVLQVNAVTRYVCSRLGLPIIDRAMSVLDVDAFEALGRSLDQNDPYYEPTRKKLLEIKENSGCRYLYTMVQEAGTVFRYVIDGSAPPDDTESFSPIGSTEDLAEWDTAVLDAINTKTVQLGSIHQSGKWGATMSVYAPILKQNGDFAGLAACDIDASGVISWIRTQVIWQLGIVVLFSLAGLLAYIAIVRRTNKLFA
jgi:methyl-accepting chemotaxis protein